MTEPAENAVTEDFCPLVVDLDGTLVKTDTLWEGILLLIKKQPLYVLLMPWWLLYGKACFKARIADRVEIDASVLPYNQSVLNLIGRSGGKRRVVLASASDHRVVESVARNLGLTGPMIGSGKINVSGQQKARAVTEFLGSEEFDYAGNAAADLPVWNRARKAYVVGSPRLAKRIDPSRQVELVSPGRPAMLPAVLRVMRPHQWAKNLLLLLPLALAHAFSADKIAQTLWALAAFCLCASGVYIINDLFDIESDRHHPKKKRRAFASGDLPIPAGIMLAALLVAVSVGMAWFAVSSAFMEIVVCYGIATLSYSLFLKNRLVIDVIVLAGLYALRLYAGSVAAVVDLSPWLLAFSLFFFLNLAFIKRYVELLQHTVSMEGKVKGRNYEVEDAQVVLSAGLGSGYISVLVFLLYLNSSTQAQELYHHPRWLWAAAPILTYWLTRIWFLARRGKVNGDPVIFAITDLVTYYCVLAIAAIVVVSAR